MSVVIATDPAPMRIDEHGSIRVGKSRVTLDIVVAAFDEGLSPEEIVHELPVLELADVYAVLGYYLRHQDELDAYLRERQQQADHVRQEIQTRWDRTGLRERLLARRNQAGA